ncbi:MAG: hypothetical protein IPN33_18055 [Saprospiraceae bacterium]|nr:hypothetical protein [Saprospiraceae bacterium]
MDAGSKKIDTKGEVLLDDWVYLQAEIIEFHIDTCYRFLSFSVWDADDNILFQTEKLVEAEQWLAGVPAGRLAELPDELRAVWLAWRFAQSLAKQSAMVPQLLDAGQLGYNIRWLPALLNETVAESFQQLSALLPRWQIVIRTQQEEWAPTGEDYPPALLSIFLTEWVSKFNGLDYPTLQEEVNKLFFEHSQVQFDKFETKEQPTAIALWLNRFFISKKNIAPILEVSEIGDELFGVNLLLEDKSAPMSAPTTLNEVFSAGEWAKKRMDVLRDLSVLAEFFPRYANCWLIKDNKR